MHERRLAEIKAEMTADLYPREAEYALAMGRELVREVETLRARLEAVCGVLADAAAFDGVVESNKVLEAVRGYRHATVAELQERIGEVPYAVLLRWIEDGKVLIRADGTFVLDDVSGLAAASMEADNGE